MTKEREGLDAKQSYLRVYAGSKYIGAYGQGGGVIVGFYSNIKGHPQDTIRVTVSEYTICYWLHHCS